MATTKLLYVAFALFLSACERPAPPSVASLRVDAPPPPDVGDVGRFLSCNAKPRRTITDREHCELKALIAECTKTSDCYVSCISSPDGPNVGGGCEHVCGHARPGPRPDTSACDYLPGASGFKQQG